MVCYKVRWKNSARKELKQLNKQHIPAIMAAVQSLAANPYPAGTKKLSGGHHTYRIRIRDCRVIYSVQDDVLMVEVIRVGHRKQVYRKV